MHDEWIYTGHCTSSFSCLNFRHGCQSCPHLSYEHKIYIDNASKNWQFRAGILKSSEMNASLVCVSQWQRNRLIGTHRSLPESRIIYNGIDSKVFRKRDTSDLLRRLGLNKDVPILITSAVGGIQNKQKTSNSCLM